MGKSCCSADKGFDDMNEIKKNRSVHGGGTHYAKSGNDSIRTLADSSVSNSSLKPIM